MSKHDQSHKDRKYFITGDTYNCPFCNRRNVKYKIEEWDAFDWDNDRKVFYYKIKCSDCENQSLHLSNLNIKRTGWDTFAEPLVGITYKEITVQPPRPGQPPYEQVDTFLKTKGGDPAELDELFFFHQPTSFFTIDIRIPKSIREPLSESENCLKNNFLTGSSAGLRKAIYKLLKHEHIPIQDGDENFHRYNERIKLLAQKYKTVEQELFHDLEVIQGLTSQELHENDWEDFDATTLRFLLEVARQLLHELYVEPELRKERQKKILGLKNAAKTT